MLNGISIYCLFLHIFPFSPFPFTQLFLTLCTIMECFIILHTTKPVYKLAVFIQFVIFIDMIKAPLWHAWDMSILFVVLKVDLNSSPKPFVSTYNLRSSPTIRPVTPIISKSDSSVVLGTSSEIKSKNVRPAAVSVISTIPADIPVNAPGLHETPPAPPHGAKDAVKLMEKPVLKAVSNCVKRSNTPNNRMSIEPSKAPLSAKLARFEQKICANTPKYGMSNSTHVTRTQKQVWVLFLEVVLFWKKKTIVF